jgi:hypothetical protein
VCPAIRVVLGLREHGSDRRRHGTGGEFLAMPGGCFRALAQNAYRKEYILRISQTTYDEREHTTYIEAVVFKPTIMMRRIAHRTGGGSHKGGRAAPTPAGSFILTLSEVAEIGRSPP